MATTKDPLATYLHDHLAGAKYAIELVQAIRDEFNGQPLGTFAASILTEIKADKQTLEELVRRVGPGPNYAKEMAAWLTEKVARLKMGPDSADHLGTFEALEFLQLGVHGKWALWRALATIARNDSRLQGMDFEGLSARAESQRSSIDQIRLEFAHVTFRTEDPAMSKSA